MMRLRWLVLLLLFLPGSARLSSHVDDSHHGGQQQNNMLASGLEVSDEVREALIPAGLGESHFRRAGLRPGASSDGLSLDDRRAGRLEVHHAVPWLRSGLRRTATPVLMAEREPLSLKVEIPPRGVCGVRFRPLLPESEAVVVRYKVPFGLNVEQQGGLAVCTKAGPGGERPGDVLRYTTEWKIGLPQGEGLITTAASFGGALSWQMGLFDVAKATSWQEVVDALLSNTAERTDTVTLIFERPL